MCLVPPTKILLEQYSMTLSPYQEMARRYRALEADMVGTMQVLRRTEAALDAANKLVEALIEDRDAALDKAGDASRLAADLQRRLSHIHGLSV
jgi:hypothetical protein